MLRNRKTPDITFLHAYSYPNFIRFVFEHISNFRRCNICLHIVRQKYGKKVTEQPRV